MWHDKVSAFMFIRPGRKSYLLQVNPAGPISPSDPTSFKKIKKINVTCNVSEPFASKLVRKQLFIFLTCARKVDKLGEQN